MRLRVLPAVLVVLPAILSAQQRGFSDPAREAELRAAFPAVDGIMREFTAREHVPGAAWAIVLDDRVVHLGATGLRDVATRAPVDSNSVFRIASMTKSFTAMAIMRLRDEGKLSLDDPAEKYVPELKALAYPTSDSPRITIRHLLSHSAGFPEDNPWGDQQLARTDAELTAMLQQGIPFSNAPGVAYEYSNYGYAILGRVVSRASGMAYNDYVSTHILRPLGMRSTTLSPSSVPAARLAHGYRWEDERWKEEPQLPDGAFGAMGGMLTSLSDLGRYVAAFIGAWPPRDGRETGPVRRSSLREMQQVWRQDAPSAGRDSTGPRLYSGGYGFGLRVWADCRFAHIVGHSGGLPGFGSRMQWLPEYGVGIIAFGNRTYTGWAAPIGAALAALSETGALRPRDAVPGMVLVHARSQVTKLVLGWDDGLARSIAAENLFLDRSLERRRAEIAALRRRTGACRAGSGFAYVENALRGQWILPCERGDLLVSVTLAPTMPPSVQFLEVIPAPPPEEVGRPELCRGD
ncbi:MAG TPA: serine hydrolase domain-containing protein [Gemmatimonadales bacterium]